MSVSELLDVTKVYSHAATLGRTPRIAIARPFRAPHHTITHIALVGGCQFRSPMRLLQCLMRFYGAIETRRHAAKRIRTTLLYFLPRMAVWRRHKLM